jgi:SAM-dependent methyltransferase
MEPMPQPLTEVLAEVRELLLDPGLTRAVAAGRRRGFTPTVTRAELRPVALKAGPKLQIVTDDGTRPLTRNVAPGAEAAAAVDALLAEPFGNWHVETASATVQVRVTKKGDAQVHRAAVAIAPAGGAAPAAGADSLAGAASAGGFADGGSAGSGLAGDFSAGGLAGGFSGGGSAGGFSGGGSAGGISGGGSAGGISGGGSTGGGSASGGSAGGAAGSVLAAPQAHDRVKQWLLDPGDPLFTVIGGNAAKRRQIDAFLRALAATLPDELPTPLRVVDLGCGNAYLTFAAYRYLAGRGVQVQVVGVDVREDQRVRNTAVAAELGCADDVTFVAGTIEDAELPFTPDLVLALHACDTATDQALARAVGWSARWVLAAPCCHHDIAAQLKGRTAPAPFGELTRHAIMRERFADVLTDSLRASLLRLNGYRVDVVEFIDSAHTPRNLMLRARRTDAPPTDAQRADYESLTSQWGVTPALEKMLS